MVMSAALAQGYLGRCCFSCFNQQAAMEMFIWAIVQIKAAGNQ
jgi:hypothetical protein